MNEIKFNSAKELYERVRPALNSKALELKRVGVNYIEVSDLWNYLRLNVWSRKDNLTLYDMVNDILVTPNEEYMEYFHNMVKKSITLVEKE